jgi:hypothetical protein
METVGRLSQSCSSRRCVVETLGGHEQMLSLVLWPEFATSRSNVQMSSADSLGYPLTTYLHMSQFVVQTIYDTYAETDWTNLIVH